MFKGHAAALAGLAGALFLAGCVQAPSNWQRTDGAPIASPQLQADTLACRGETTKAAIQGQAQSTIDAPLGMDHQDYRVFVGCMAGKGYLAR